MRVFRFLFVLLISLLFIGCWSSEVPKNVSNNENLNVNNSQPKENENPDIGKNEAVNESSGETTKEESPKIETYDPPPNKELSPMETLKAFNLASLKKDSQKIKNLITKGSIHFITQKAKDENLTFEQMIAEGKGVPAFETTKIFDEEISGNNASVKIKFEDRDAFDKVPLVKEDGKWKIDFVQFFKDIVTQTNQ